MTSPPATSPHELSSDDEDWRFKEINADCEWVEEYRPGGFHPVNLGDTFQDGQYKTIRKLGEGSYSIVWLVVSTSVPKYAALKIMTAGSSAATVELTMLDHLSKAAPGDSDSQHVTKLLDSFKHEGPNGIHQCLVIEIMGASAASLVEELPENNPKLWDVPQRYSVSMAKKILLHALRALAFLHKNDVVHGDVQPGNLLFTVDDLDEVKEQELEQNEVETAILVQRLDGKTDRWAPRSLYKRQPLHDRVKLGSELCVKISDFGAAFFVFDPPASTITPSGLRAPELILKRPFGTGIDVWAFGCLVYEFLTGEPLFAVMPGDDEDEAEEANDDHLVQMNDKIRPLPEWIANERPSTIPRHDSPCGIESYKVVEQRFAKSKHPDIDDEEAATICQLIRKILVYDPAERPSAEELLKHPWFSDCVDARQGVESDLEDTQRIECST